MSIVESGMSLAKVSHISGITFHLSLYCWIGIGTVESALIFISIIPILLWEKDEDISKGVDKELDVDPLDIRNGVDRNACIITHTFTSMHN